MEKLSADALRLALVTASMEYYKRLEDPIVFRATKIGIVIVSMWGEEASDSMFDKYR